MVVHAGSASAPGLDFGALVVEPGLELELDVAESVTVDSDTIMYYGSDSAPGLDFGALAVGERQVPVLGLEPELAEFASVNTIM